MLAGHDLDRVLAIVNGLYLNELALRAHRPGEPMPEFSVPARLRPGRI